MGRYDAFEIIYEKLLADKSSFKSSYDEGIQAVLNGGGKYVFIGEEPLLRQAVEKNCNLRLTSKGVSPQSYAFGLQKSKLKSLFYRISHFSG